MRGIVIWSIILIYGFWRAPKILPYSVKLARTAVMCGGIAFLAAVYSESRGVHYWSPDLRTTVVTLFLGVGIFGALICGAIAFILDAKRRPSSLERVIAKK
jgi:hypothetical protein